MITQINDLHIWTENIARNTQSLNEPFRSDQHHFLTTINSLANELSDIEPFFSKELYRIQNVIFYQATNIYGIIVTHISPVIFGELLEIIRYLHTNIKPPKIFISHATADEKYIAEFVTLLEKMGIKQEQLFCSSISGYDIPINNNIYDFLHNEFSKNNLLVIFMLSNNYYKRPACLNEMGAAWALKTEYQSILLPGFQFNNIDGAIDPRKICFSLEDKDQREGRLTELKERITRFLSLEYTDSVLWERHRKEFLSGIDLLTNGAK